MISEQGQIYKILPTVQNFVDGRGPLLSNKCYVEYVVQTYKVFSILDFTSGMAQTHQSKCSLLGRK